MTKIKKGLIIKNTESQKRGVVIDCGVKNMMFRRYIPLREHSDTATDVRVWTASDIEIWPIYAVEEEMAA